MKKKDLNLVYEQISTYFSINFKGIKSQFCVIFDYSITKIRKSVYIDIAINHVNITHYFLRHLASFTETII